LSRVPAEQLPEDKRFNPLSSTPYVLFKALPQVKGYSRKTGSGDDFYSNAITGWFQAGWKNRWFCSKLWCRLWGMAASS